MVENKKKRGRPTGQNNKTKFSIYLPNELKGFYEYLAQAEGINLTQVIEKGLIAHRMSIKTGKLSSISTMHRELVEYQASVGNIYQGVPTTETLEIPEQEIIANKIAIEEPVVEKEADITGIATIEEMRENQAKSNIPSTMTRPKKTKK